METHTRERAAELFSALGSPSRLRIVELLIEGPRSVGQIVAATDIGQSGVSQHLAILTRAGVLLVHPQGASRIYSVRGQRIGRIVGLIAEFCAVHGLYGAVEENDAEQAEVQHA